MLLSNENSKQYFLNSISFKDQDDKTETDCVTIEQMSDFFRIIIKHIVGAN